MNKKNIFNLSLFLILIGFITTSLADETLKTKEISVREFKAILTKVPTEGIVKELKDYPLFKKSVGKVKVTLPDGRIVRSTTLTTTKYIDNKYILVEINIDQQRILYNLIGWDSLNKCYISWHINKNSIPLVTEDTNLSKAHGKQQADGSYKYKSTPKPGNKETVTLTKKPDHIHYLSTLQMTSKDGAVNTLLIEGIEKASK
jgi:hypothetical protein